MRCSVRTRVGNLLWWTAYNIWTDIFTFNDFNRNEWPHIYMQNWTKPRFSNVQFFVWIFHRKEIGVKKSGGEKNAWRYKRSKILFRILACILSKLTSDGKHSRHWNQPPGKSTSCQVVGAGNNCKFTWTTEIQSFNLYIYRFEHKTS